MDYEAGYVYKLMDQGGPTDNREPYFKEAVDEMMRARVLCARANAKMPDDPTYVNDLEELFGRKLDDVRILTPFICDFGNRVKFGKGVFLNHSAILSGRYHRRVCGSSSRSGCHKGRTCLCGSRRSTCESDQNAGSVGTEGINP